MAEFHVTNAVADFIKARGISPTAVAENTGISYGAPYNYDSTEIQVQHGIPGGAS